MAISRARPVPRTSINPARLAQTISRTKPTAPATPAAPTEIAAELRAQRIHADHQLAPRFRIVVPDLHTDRFDLLLAQLAIFQRASVRPH